MADKDDKKDKNAPEQSGFDQAKLYVWVKALESKVNNLLREINVIKNDSTKKQGDMKKELKNLSEDIMELKRDEAKNIQKMDLIIKELKQTAGIEEVRTLKKYVEFWNPMNFVTQRDLERKVDLYREEQSKSSQKNNLQNDKKIEVSAKSTLGSKSKKC